MKARRARYTPEAAERIRKLHPLIKKEVREGIRSLLDNPLMGYALHDELSGYWSFRIRTYRVIFRPNDDESTVDVVYVGPRRSVYEELRALLLEQRDKD
ncbi:MAG TPA: type II toxin-antitoxin system RelE/ParE family toxin [Nitrospirales bacterium]